ncbi:MAG: response regulator [Leptospiraceae bacterium]|nr:response regulator [Leptospiraceae bacterium]
METKNHPATILVIDDEAPVRESLRDYLEDRSFTVLEAESGRQALDLMNKEAVDLVLLDLRMPEMDGLQVLRVLHSVFPQTPVIIVSGAGSLQDAIQCLRFGAWDYITKPVQDMGLLQHRMEKALERSNLQKQNDQYQHHLEELVKEKSSAIVNENEILKDALGDTIRVIDRLVERKDPYTAGHQKRVAVLADAISAYMNLNQNQREGLFLAATIHDLGKVTVPSALLVKPGKLTEPEFGVIKQHAAAGFDILKEARFPWPIATIVQQHHERADGTGYPLGIKGSEMLIESRILAIADVVEAMSSNRPYRFGRGIEATLAEIQRGIGSIYDPDAAAACLQLFEKKQFLFEEWRLV